MKRPAFQFYPADWRKDNELQSCSVGARGLWIEMICIAHECEPYGRLVVNGRPMTDLQIARLVGISPREFASLLLQLTDAGVVGRDEAGALYSRRMVRDEQVRDARAAGGAAGAEHGHKGGKSGAKGGRPVTSKGSKEPPLHHPLNPPPSSSTSSSSSPSVEDFALRASEKAANPKVQLPDWIPQETWDAFVEMRRKIRKPLTHQAMLLAIGKLRKLHGKGEDIQAVLEQSILGSYQGLFAVKQENGARYGGKSSQHSFASSISQAAVERAAGGGLFAGPGEGAGGDAGFDHPQDHRGPPAIAGR